MELYVAVHDVSIHHFLFPFFILSSWISDSQRLSDHGANVCPSTILSPRILRLETRCQSATFTRFSSEKEWSADQLQEVSHKVILAAGFKHVLFSFGVSPCHPSASCMYREGLHQLGLFYGRKLTASSAQRWFNHQPGSLMS